METIFAGDLSFFCNEDHLQSLFSSFGTVKSAIIRRGKGGENLQYGFIQMTDSDARKAVATLNGTKFLGRKLRLNIAEHANDRSIPPNRGELVKVLVSFVSHTNCDYISEEVLDGIFSIYGEVEDCTIKHYAVATDPPGKHSGYGFVYFLDMNAALKAIQDINEGLQGHVQGLVLDCHLSHDSAKRMQKHQPDVNSQAEPSAEITGNSDDSSASPLKIETTDASGANAAKINHYASFFKPSSIGTSTTASSHTYKIGSPSTHLRKSSSSMLNKSQSSHSIVSSMSSLSTSYPSTPVSRSTSGKQIHTMHPSFVPPVNHTGTSMVPNNTIVLQPVPVFPPQLSSQPPIFTAMPPAQPMHYFQPPPSQYQVASDVASNSVYAHHPPPPRTTVDAAPTNYYPTTPYVTKNPSVHDNTMHNLQQIPSQSHPPAPHSTMMVVPTMMFPSNNSHINHINNNTSNDIHNHHLNQLPITTQVASSCNTTMVMYPPPPVSYPNITHHPMHSSNAPTYPMPNVYYSPMLPQSYLPAAAHPHPQAHSHVSTMSSSSTNPTKQNHKNHPPAGSCVPYSHQNNNNIHNHPSFYNPPQKH